MEKKGNITHLNKENVLENRIFLLAIKFFQEYSQVQNLTA